MKRGHQRDPMVSAPLPSVACDLKIPSHKGLAGDPAQGTDDFRPDDAELRFEEGKTHPDFIGIRIAVARGATFDNVADVNLIPGKPHAAFNDPGEQLS